MGSELDFGMLLGAAISIAAIICFFVLCYNVSQIKKQLVEYRGNDYDEYLILEKIGEKEKAFYHLKRSLAADELKGVSDEEIKMYLDKFEKLGMGIPDMEILKAK